jgi:hypothetical protein
MRTSPQPVRSYNHQPCRDKETAMKTSFLAAIALSSLAMAAMAEDFDGSKPMICTPVQGHDCLPTEKSCKALEPRLEKANDFGFDIANKVVWSPYRTKNLPIEHVSTNAESLVLQGTTLQLVWSGTIHRKTGRMTIAVTDREGAYVVFGQCKLGSIAQPAS